MFRLFTILVFSIFVSSAAFAHDNEWRNRHYHRHNVEQFGYRYNNPHYRAYARPPAVGYYRAPAEYYGLPPVRGFVYQRPIPMPRYDRNNRRDW